MTDTKPRPDASQRTSAARCGSGILILLCPRCRSRIVRPGTAPASACPRCHAPKDLLMEIERLTGLAGMTCTIVDELPPQKSPHNSADQEQSID